MKVNMERRSENEKNIIDNRDERHFKEQLHKHLSNEKRLKR